MRSPLHRRGAAAALLAGLLLAGEAAASPPDPSHDPAGFLLHALGVACPETGLSAEGLRARLSAVAVHDEERRASARGTMTERLSLALGDGGLLHLERVSHGRRLLRFAVEHHAVVKGTPRPSRLLLAGPDCRVGEARRLTYDAAGRQESLQRLDLDDLETPVEALALNPPLPEGRDPGGVRVAHVDSGVAYTLPAIAERLARDAEGRPLGYDYWEMDARPFDLDTARSPFLPRHHGTGVASLLLREAPAASLIPYRYPRPEMSRMRDLIDAAAAAGARIVALPMGSRDAEAWHAFRETAEAREEMLFIVSAGNENRDLDRQPTYPPAFDLANMLVVSSSEDDGRLAPGSNHGAETVDLLVPAENQVVLDHRGREVAASGSSYAVARVAALAARLLDDDPALSTEDLKAAILARAVPAPPQAGGLYSRHGWLPDPAAR